MKSNYKIIATVVLLSVVFFAFKIQSDSHANPEKDKMLMELLTYVLAKGHYNPVKIDDSFSKGVYKDYVEALDPSKRCLLYTSPSPRDV
jgi:carboxyl-terminal processing protease